VGTAPGVGAGSAVGRASAGCLGIASSLVSTEAGNQRPVCDVLLDALKVASVCGTLRG